MALGTYDPDTHRDHDYEKVILKEEEDGWTLRKANYQIIAEYGEWGNAMTCAQHTGEEVVVEYLSEPDDER